MAAANIFLMSDARRPDLSKRIAAMEDAVSDALFTTDLDNVVTSWNAASARVFGWTRAEMIGQSVLTLFASDPSDEERDIIARVTGGESIRDFETVRRRKDGTLVAVSLNVSPIVDSDGTTVGTVRIVRDVSESSRVERDLDLGQGRCGSPLQLDEFGANRRALDDDGERDAEREQNERRDPDDRRRDAASHSTTRR